MPDGHLRLPAQNQIPLPSPTLLTLPSEINNATRSLHTELNSLITGRLLLALPPNAADPALYAVGISIFAQIYIAFEQAHSDLISATLETPTTDPADPHEAHLLAIRTCLATLTPAGLWRTKRLENDLQALKARLGIDVENHQTSCRPIADLTAHIHSVTQSRPHVLIAYQWVMYMAIFSGGRWIRQRLRDAGAEFWTESADGKEESSTRGYSVFEFDGTSDGEDIKSDFKERLGAVEQLFTEQERGEVVEEAKRLFRACIDTVHDLDETARELTTEAKWSAIRPGGLVDRYDRASLSAQSNLALLVVFAGCVVWHLLRSLGVI